MKKYQKVRMLNVKYIEDGIKKGLIGYILKIYDQNYCEIEFSDKDGTTIAIQAINKEDFYVLED